MGSLFSPSEVPKRPPTAHGAHLGTAAPATVSASSAHRVGGDSNELPGETPASQAPFQSFSYSELVPRTHTLPSDIFSLGTQVVGINLNSGPAALCLPPLILLRCNSVKCASETVFFSCWLFIELDVFFKIFIREVINAHMFDGFKIS